MKAMDVCRWFLLEKETTGWIILGMGSHKRRKSKALKMPKDDKSLKITFLISVIH